MDRHKLLQVVSFSSCTPSSAQGPRFQRLLGVDCDKSIYMQSVDLSMDGRTRYNNVFGDLRCFDLGDISTPQTHSHFTNTQHTAEVRSLYIQPLVRDTDCHILDRFGVASSIRTYR